ncbi:MAG TPA: hypothetical protein VMR18_01015 [Candidatus Saccharimonadales bacterium]|nr:hypothetical protein [Candidatus Saccharimonadales bacterium]
MKKAVRCILMENEPEGSTSSKMISHGFSNTVPASADQLRDAALILRVGWSGSPVETYRDFELGAQNAAWVDGDYTDAVLKAAVAAEVLLKHTAWMLTWEVSEEEKANTSSTAATFDPFKAKPGRLIGNVLARRLGGDWSSRDEAKPIGAWRSHIARRRNAVIHTGYRPNEAEVQQTVEALHRLEQHVLDRLAVRAAVYPQTAIGLFFACSLQNGSLLEIEGAGHWYAEGDEWQRMATAIVEFMANEL